VRLTDVESGAADLVIDDSAAAGYRERLGRLDAAWRGALHGRGAGVIAVRSEDGLDGAVRALVRGGLALATVAA
jgi:hypothetical protein